jgi:hypothetical protein
MAYLPAHRNRGMQYAEAEQFCKERLLREIQANSMGHQHGIMLDPLQGHLDQKSTLRWRTA